LHGGRMVHGANIDTAVLVQMAGLEGVDALQNWWITSVLLMKWTKR